MQRIGKLQLLLCLVSLILLDGCQQSPNASGSEDLNVEVEKTAILKTLNGETQSFFARDYDGWRSMWVQEDFVTKSYMILTDSSLSETLGWKGIDKFATDYFRAHPAPETAPTPLTDVNVRLYGTGAWVTYQQQDPIRGLKRETRLMEKTDGKWKIAGMHTTIYGFQE